MRYIYILKDSSNGDIRYVGQTDNLQRRYNSHINSSVNEKSYSYNTHKSFWIRKLINLNLKPLMEVIDTCENLEQSNMREKYWIDKLSQDGIKLTNSYMTDVTEFSIETRKKMSNAKKGKKLEEIVGEEKALELKIYYSEKWKKNNPNKCYDPEVKERISNTLKEFFSDKKNHWAYGKKMSEEHNEKLRQSKLNNPKNIGNTRPRTDEEKRKIREKILGSKIKRSEILQFDLSGNLIREWKSLREIDRETDFYRTQIAKCCKGIKEGYGGYIWKYKENI